MVEFKINIEQIYFRLLAEFVNFPSDPEYILGKMTKQIKDKYNANLVALYIHNEYDQDYHLSSYASINDSFLPEKIISKKGNHNKNLIFHQFPYGHHLKVYPLHFHNTCSAMLVIATEILISEELYIIEETEKFLGNITRIHEERTNNNNHKFLLDLSTKLFSETNKSRILTQIIQDLNILYPNFTCTLLLSQDNEEFSYLPVKTIECNSTSNLSTKTFITGECQLAVMPKEQKVYLYAPLTGKQGIYGVLQIVTDKVIHFTKKQKEFVKQFSQLAGTALERATLYENSMHQVNSLSLINDFAQKLNANLEVLEIIKLLREEIIHICQPAEIGFVLTEDSRELKLIDQSTMFFKTVEGKRFAKQIYLQLSTNRESLFSGKYSDEALPFNSVMAIPINHSSYRHGFTIILQNDEYSFSFESFKLIETLIQHATLALSNAYLKDELHRSVITDYLTGLYSRNYLESKIREDMNQGEMGVLLLFDIDDFKKINDKYGHHVGDEVIKQVAEVLLFYSGSNDVPARWGGEELAIYLPNRTLEESEKIADLIRNEVAAVTEPHITMSCGISSWVRGEKHSIINLFIQTDKALYKAKNKGKNCVVKN
ncbi:sensor domain-containing diguanylate cyclase [Oceanobacillus halophilus]|nr:sensor domain-containing diguanylate cyclase [Oceanobacillus halophilus]